MLGSLVCLGLGPPGTCGHVGGGAVPCLGPTPALPVRTAGPALWTSEAGSGQEHGRGHSGGVQALLSGRQTPCTRRPSLQPDNPPPPPTQG